MYVIRYLYKYRRDLYNLIVFVRGPLVESMAISCRWTFSCLEIFLLRRRGKISVGLLKQLWQCKIDTGIYIWWQT